MKKATKINARYTLAAILSVMLLTALVGFAAGDVKSADASDAGKQITDYGTVDWSNAAQGYISFTASEGGEFFVLQGPSGEQKIIAVNAGETVNLALTDGTGTYQYAIGRRTNDESALQIAYKGSCTVNATDTDLMP